MLTVLMIACYMGTFGTFAFCESTAGATVSAILKQVCTWFQYIGIIVLVIGVVKFGLALKDDNPDGQARASYYAIAGALLIGIKPVLSAIITAAGVEGVSIN